MKASKSLWLILAAGIAAGGSLVPNSHAADRPLRDGTLAHRIRERAKERLGITEEQGAQIRAVLAAEKEALTGRLQELHDTRIELRQAIREPGATEASVRAASAKVAAVEADLAVERSRIHGKIAPILTDEQRQKLRDFQARIDHFLDMAIDRIGEGLAE